MSGVRNAVRPVVGGPGRGVKRMLLACKQLHLRWVYASEGIRGISRELRTMRRGHAVVLRQFGASVAKDAEILGPLSIQNAYEDFSNLVIEAGAHLNEEVFIDLAEQVTIGEKAVLAARVILVTHFDAGHSAVAERHPRTSGPVTIEPGAFLGAASMVLRGVTIGAGAMVPAGMIVSRDVPPGTDAKR